MFVQQSHPHHCSVDGVFDATTDTILSTLPMVTLVIAAAKIYSTLKERRKTQTGIEIGDDNRHLKDE